MNITFKFEFHIIVDKEKKNTETASGSAENNSVINMFLESAKAELEQLRTSLSMSTIENYKTALSAFKRYLGRDISIASINKTVIKGFERWLRDKNVCLNSTSCYMRSLRSMLNRLDSENKTNAFEGTYTGRAKTEKRAISESDIVSIKKLQLRPFKFQSLVRDIFMFSYYALGMPFVDVAFLRRSQINGNQLVYYRHKTGQRVVVPLEPCMLDIINRYNQGGEYVFPILKSLDQPQAYKEYLHMLNRYNRSLKSLAKKAGLNIRLTSYTARHTWASIAHASNVDMPVISKALGHTNTQTTLTYIKEINDDRLVEASRRIICRI